MVSFSSLSKNFFAKPITSHYSREVIDILRLIRSENIGPRTFRSLIQSYGSATKALAYVPALATIGGRHKPIRIYSDKEAFDEIRELDRIGAKLMTYLDPDYPEMLKKIKDAPPIISYLGNPKLFNTKTCAVVGARNSSLNGRHMASSIAKNLADNGITVVSGLARGIDAAAHSAALPNTVAVIAGGIDHIYPKENDALYHEIAERGAIIAENRIGSTPVAASFPQRNRIIAGMAHTTLVIEASIKSGSLITARMALEAGRDVCAVPGFPLDPRSEGANKLIKEGAYLVESYHDVVDLCNNEYRIYTEHRDAYKPLLIKTEEDNPREASREAVKALLSSMPVQIDSIIRNTGLPVPLVCTVLMEMELAGTVERHPGNQYTLVYS